MQENGSDKSLVIILEDQKNLKVLEKKGMTQEVLNVHGERDIITQKDPNHTKVLEMNGVNPNHIRERDQIDTMKRQVVGIGETVINLMNLELSQRI